MLTRQRPRDARSAAILRSKMAAVRRVRRRVENADTDTERAAAAASPESA